MELDVPKSSVEIFHKGNCLFEFYKVNDYEIKNNDSLEIYSLNHGIMNYEPSFECSSEENNIKVLKGEFWRKLKGDFLRDLV